MILYLKKFIQFQIHLTVCSDVIPSHQMYVQMLIHIHLIVYVHIQLCDDQM